MEGRMKPHKYRCAHCGRTVRRESDKKWIESYCLPTGKNVRLQRVTRKPREEERDEQEAAERAEERRQHELDRMRRAEEEAHYEQEQYGHEGGPKE
jgi:hypothetical protein